MLTTPFSFRFCLYIFLIVQACPWTWLAFILCAITANSFCLTLAPSLKVFSYLLFISQLVQACLSFIVSIMLPNASLRIATALPTTFAQFTCSRSSLYVLLFSSNNSKPCTTTISCLQCKGICFCKVTCLALRLCCKRI